MEFHNNTVMLNTMWYESHKSLITNICIELNAVDKIADMTSKFLGNKLKIKSRKDPNKPKRAKSGFFYFCEAKRPHLIEECRNNDKKVNIGQITKQLGLMWGQEKNSPKKCIKYFNKAEQDRKRYVLAMEQYKM